MDNVKHQDKATLKNVFLVHGEGESMKLLANSLEEEGYTVTIPEKDVTYDTLTLCYIIKCVKMS
jgi:metallo-beta-lactamase family protein